jgi:hypothetical protein
MGGVTGKPGSAKGAAATAAAVLSAVLLSAIGGCDDDAGVIAAPDAPVVEETSRSEDWLRPDDDRRPAVWLAARDVAAGPGDVARYGALLARVGDYYHETPRMIANRMAQLHTELAPRSPGLTVATLLEDFSWRAGNSRRQTIGEVAQHYLVLRREGRSHGEAIDAVRTAYGAEPEQ